MKRKQRIFRKQTSLFLAVLLLVSTFLPSGLALKASASIADHVVISQVYGAGGNSNAPLKQDFIELYNPTNKPIVLDNKSVQYASKSGAFSSTNTIALSGSIPAYGFYLVQLAAGSGSVPSIPTAEATGTTNMSGTDGKVALVDNTTPISGKDDEDVIDFVGYGSGASEFEGTAPIRVASNTESAQRRPYANELPGSGTGNAWDTNDNGSDFVSLSVNPRNSESPAESPMQSDKSLQPAGNSIQFTLEGSTGKVTGYTEAALADSNIKVYETSSKGTVLGTGKAAADGAFEVSFSTDKNLTSIFITATQGEKKESDTTEINLAAASESLNAENLSYSVDQNGNGTLIGNEGAAVANSLINVYPNSSVDKSERLNSDVTKAMTNGGFNAITFSDAPEKVYVTQQSSSTNGMMLESTPVAVEKADTNAVTPLNVAKQTDSKGFLTNLNQSFSVEGVVTVDNGIMGTQKNNFYIQDATGGINVFGDYDSGLTIKRGDKLRVTGKVIQYRGLTELEATAIYKIGEGKILPAAKETTILGLNTFTVAEPLEGSLVKVNGKVSAVSGSGNVNVTLVDENSKATTVRVMSSTGINVDSDLVVGKNYSITGIVGQYTSSTASHTSGYQVFPRDKNDLAAELSIEHTPLTEVYKNTDIEFVANASGAESAAVYYKAKNTAEYSVLPMTAGSEGRYTAVLKAPQVPADGFVYYIEAKAGDNVKASGTKETPHQVKVVMDEEGPRIYSETPVGGSKVESPRPEISVLLEDPSGVDETSIQVSLDGSELTSATITKSQVKFIPAEDLSLGVHTVKVTASDARNNSSTYEWTFEVVPRFEGGQHFRGTTHNHTNISHDGAGAPEDALKAGQRYGYDWFAFSDHSHDIDPTLLGQDTVERDGMQERKGGADWQLTKDLAAQYTKNDEFVVFPAFEMTSTTWGHSNIFGTENFIDRNINGKMYQDLNNYYAWVMKYDDLVGQFNHPDMSKNAFNNFKPYNKGADKLFTMLEVGNGSGHYGYANAEKKFFSVLDLGWHVAPTYGEDNHEGTWGQTRARTIIVAEDLTQESLLHSMRNMRVYMVEDPNFTLDVKANGFYMGSTVDSKSLNFNISGRDLVTESNSNPDYNYLSDDYKSDDRIEKVELITNGGKVVDSISPMEKEFTWEPSYKVTGGQQWFVVKVTQMDGEQMYSAPIWSKEEAVDVKVNGIDVAGDVIIEGNPAALKANVSNNGIQEVKNVKVDLYYDEVKETNLIGSETISSIIPKGVGTAAAVWESPLKGDHKIIAVVTSLDGLDLGDTTFVLPVEIKEPLGINVMIDAKHGNENTSGDSGSYKDNLKSFTTMLQKEGYTVAENKATVTDAVLSDTDVLVITHPKYAYTADESAAIAKFVKNGGSVLMTSKSNYGTNTTINNTMLSEIGTAIRMGNDGVFDVSEDGNFWSDPSKSPFAVRVYPEPVSNYITDRVSFMDYYSGGSLSGADNQPLTDSDKVTILARGNETTYQGSVKGGYTYDDVSDESGGSAIPLIASEEIGEKGRIVVSGMNIFNDKQLDESYEPKGNDEFALNAVNWLAHRGTTVTKIEDARKLAEDTHTVIEGTVTTGAGVFFDAFYVQDETGGIMAFQEVPAGSLKPGDKVRIYGHIITFDNNKEIEFAKFDQDVIKIGEGDPILPKAVDTGVATSEANQGLLVKVTGKVVSQFDANSYVINDGSGDVLVFTDGYIVNQSGPVPVLKVGDTLEAVGLSGSFAEGTRIRVRDTKELVKVDTTAPVTTATVNQESPDGENGWYTTDVTVTLTSVDEESGVNSPEYRINGGEWLGYTEAIQFNKDGIFTLEFHGSDVSGNVEEIKSIEIKVDKSAPETSVSVNPENATGTNGWYTSDVSVSLSATDSMTEVETTQYRINGGDWTSYSEALQLAFDGIYMIEYRSVDGAGNIEETQMKEIKIDLTAPELSVSVDKPILLVPNHKLVDIKALLEYSDVTSGIGSVVLESITVNEANADSSDINGALYKTLDTEFALRSERNGKGNGRIYTITYLTTDQAGNTTEAQATVTVLKGR
jgi:DNA/RNA endonuclease YhcR with UshA esterase domain